MSAGASRESYRKWVMSALRAIGPASPARVYAWIRENEAVPPCDLITSTADGKDTVFEKNVRWARKDLFDEGAVASPARGIWSLI